MLVPREGIEPSTCALEGRRSILLSYRGMLVAKVGLEPTRSFPPRDFRNTMTFVTSIMLFVLWTLP